MPNSNLKNPMKGFMPFEQSDASNYYADASQVEAFARQLERSHFVVVTGPKGIGKTSFLNAVFSETYKRIRPDQDLWVSACIRPGIMPIKSMAYALSMVGFSQTPTSPDFAIQVEELLHKSTNGLAALFEKYSIAPGTKLLLVIDPLDDLFLLSDIVSDGQRAEQRILQFINLLSVFEQQCKDIPVYVLISFSNSVPEKVGSYPKFLDLMERTKFVFKGPEISELTQILDCLVPEAIQKAEGYKPFVSLLRSEVERELSNRPEWLLYVQHALKRTFDLWLERPGDFITYYQQVGGVKHSFIQHADEIYQAYYGKAQQEYSKNDGESHRRVFELFLRSMMDGKGTIVPLQYGQIVDQATRYYKNDKNTIERSMIRPFVNDLGPMGLGFLELIRSVDEADRAKVLMDRSIIADNDILFVKNTQLADQWPLLNTFKNAKTKLMNEYEWYARIALEKLKKREYPTTLQPYALADPNRDKSKDPEEFHVIEELMLINEAWVVNNFGSTRPDQASYEQTKTYISQGIKHWQIKEREEKAAAQKKERKKKLMSRILWVTLLMVTIVYVFFQEMDKLHSRMKDQLDCIYYENKRMISFIDSVHIQRLESFQERDSLSKLRLGTKTKMWRDALRDFSNHMDLPHDSLYQEGIVRFSLNYFSWKHTCELIVDSGSSIHKNVLEGAISDTDFLRSYRSVVEINFPDACENIPKDAVYFINCKKCEACTVCQ